MIKQGHQKGLKWKHSHCPSISCPWDWGSVPVKSGSSQNESQWNKSFWSKAIQCHQEKSQRDPIALSHGLTWDKRSYDFVVWSWGYVHVLLLRTVVSCSLTSTISFPRPASACSPLCSLPPLSLLLSHIYVHSIVCLCLSLPVCLC